MAVNRGKQFEEVIKESFLKVPNVCVTRLPDPTQGYLGIRNISDFIVYKYPHQYFIECKSVHGNTLPFSNITENQWQGMLEMSKIKGVIAGVICWWIDLDVTRFIPIYALQRIKDTGEKSIRYDRKYEFRKFVAFGDVRLYDPLIYIVGKKKRVFFDYDMSQFFDEVEQNEV